MSSGFWDGEGREYRGQAGACAVGQWRQLQTHIVSLVGDQITRAARHRHDPDAAPRQRAGVRAQHSGADQVFDRTHPDDAFLPQKRIDHPVITNQCTGVRLRRRGREFRGARLQDDDRLAQLGGAACRRTEHVGFADGLGEDAD